MKNIKTHNAITISLIVTFSLSFHTPGLVFWQGLSNIYTHAIDYNLPETQSSTIGPPTIDIHDDPDFLYGWFPLSTDPTPSPADCDDGSIVVSDLDIYYLGQHYTQGIWSVNGTLELGIQSGMSVPFSNQKLPDPDLPYALLAPWWTDLTLCGGGNWYHYEESGGGRSYNIFEWSNVPEFGDNSKTATFRIWLERGTENIWFVYSFLGGIDGTVGAQNQDGSVGQSYYVDGAGIRPNPLTGFDYRALLVDQIPGSRSVNALGFNGVDDYLQLAFTDDGRNEFSIEMWLRPTSPAGGGIFAWEESLGETEPFIYFQDSGGSLIPYFNGRNHNAIPLSINEWTHIAITYETGLLGGWFLYKNGGLVWGYYSEGTANRPGVYLHFGQALHGPWSGQIDEVRVWDFARNQTQIGSDMYRELSGAEPGLLANYKLDDGSGSLTAVDSASGNHGTLVNMDANTAWVGRTWTGGSYSKSGGLAVLDVGFPQRLTDSITFSHNGLIGSTRNNLPSPLFDNGFRLARIWDYCVIEEGIRYEDVTLFINLDAAGMGNLPSGGEMSNYKLLVRIAAASDFTVLATATSYDPLQRTVTFAGLDAINSCSQITLGILDADATGSIVYLPMTIR